MSSSLAELACTVPWCITPAAFEAMLSIAERDPLPEAEIAQAMHGPKSLALRNGKRRDDSGRTTQHEGVALIPVDGPIYRYADYFTKVSGGVTTEQLARDYQAALDDPTISAIIGIFDSPGGEGQGINELSDLIYQSRGRKPLIAYVESQAASAAYWIASAHDEVIVDDTALVGSIGTVVSVPDPAKRFSRSIDFVSTQSPRKRPDPTTDAGKKDIQDIADALTDVFIEKVARNMGVSVETVMRDFGQGGQLVGKQAIAAGMAHRLGSEDGVIQELTARAMRRPLLGRLSSMVRPTMEEERMKVSQFIAGIFNGAKEAGIELEADNPAEPATAKESPVATVAGELLIAQAEPSPEVQAQAARIAELEKHLAAQRVQQIQVAATTFADTAVRDRRAFPAEHAALVALYAAAAQDDDAYPRAAEAASRVALVEAQITARPQHSLSAELIATGQGGVLEAGGDKQEMSAERRQKLLAMTPLGQAALKAKKTKSA